MVGNFLNFYTVLLLSKSKASNVSEVYGNMLLKLYNGHPKCEKTPFFYLFCGQVFGNCNAPKSCLTQVLEIPVPVFKREQNKEKSQKALFLTFYEKKCITKYHFYVRTRFRMLHIAIAKYRVFTVHLENLKYDQNQDFCFQISNLTIFFFF